ncbi:hypothetical protein BDZ88DRAFT_441330 [Geranomyces variabilis]|nr:hypothetical protein BDZ88DRAFT_441330 [Geranomyces variabilis]KAJ3136108.1 hypothetical protein HDU90_003511 [Geranomyces variabilis]
MASSAATAPEAATTATALEAVAAAESPITDSHDSQSHAKGKHGAPENSSGPLPPNKPVSNAPNLPSEVICMILAQRAITAADHVPFLSACREYRSIAIASLSHRILANSFETVPELRVYCSTTLSPYKKMTDYTKVLAGQGFKRKDCNTIRLSCAPTKGRGPTAPPLLRQDGPAV